MKLNEHLTELLTKRNTLAEEINAAGIEIIKSRDEAEKNHAASCPCKAAPVDGVRAECTDIAYKEKMGNLTTAIATQKEKRTEVEGLDELIGVTTKMSEREIEVEAIVKTEKPVTENGMMPSANKLLYPNRQKFYEKVGTDFYNFLQKTNMLKKDDIKGSRVLSTDILGNGERFNSVASFYASFGKTTQELDATVTEVGGEVSDIKGVQDAVKSTRDTVKSMFTQVPGLSGGAGALYDPTATFGGNTGGLCEYMIDDTVDVLPYPPASFLECIPVRPIPKSYILFARQTVRINNAAAVGESVQLLTTANPTGATVDFRPIKPESEFGWTQAKAITLTFADTLAVSEEFLEDCPAIVNAVESQLMENVRQEFYDQFINGDGSTGTNPQLIGLLAQVGVSTRIHRGAASFFGNTMGAGAADDDTRMTMVRAIFDGQAFGYTMDCAIMSHQDYVDMYFLKNEDGNPLYTDEELNNILGVRVTKDIRMPEGTAIVGAFRQVVQMLIRRAIRLDIGWIDKQFKQDMLTLRATLRGGIMVRAPQALVRITGL